MKIFRKFLFLSLVFLILILVISYFFSGAKLNSVKNWDQFFRVNTPNIVRISLPENQITRLDSAVEPRQASQPVNHTYSFAVISDIHSDYINLQKTLDRIRTDKISFIVIVGDLTTLGKLPELKKVKTILDSNKIPYYAVPGNHDLWSGSNWQDVFGPYYQVFQKENVKFILINNGDEIIGIDKKQKTWLDKELVDCPKIYCLVFMHEPLNNPTSEHIMGEDSSSVAGQADLLVKQLVAFQVKQLFAGHIHYLSTYTLDGLKTTTDGAIKDVPRFVEVTVSQPETKIEEKRIWLNNNI